MEEEESWRRRSRGGGGASINRWVFTRRQNVTIFPADVTLTGSECHIVGASTEKALFLTFVLTLGAVNVNMLDEST